MKPFKKGEQRARDAGRRGGIASGQSKRETLRELLLAELDAEHWEGFPVEEPTGRTRRAALAGRLVSWAMSGNMKALQVILKAEGSLQTEENEVQSVSEA